MVGAGALGGIAALTADDEERAEDDGADEAVLERARLGFFGRLEVVEDQREDEEVIHRE